MEEIKLPKLPRGEGSMHIRKDGIIMYRKSIKLDSCTVQKCVYAKTVKDVKRKMKDVEAELRLSTRAVQLNETLCDALYYWLEHYKKPTLKKQSYDRLKGTIKNQIEFSEIGHYRWQSISVDELQGLIEKLNNEAFSQSTIKKTYDCLKSFYSYMSLKYKVDNPMLLVSMPNRNNLVSSKKSIVWFDQDDISKFVREADARWNTGNSKYQGGNALAANLYLGLRGGELLALQWKDIDFEKNTIYVHKTLIEARDLSGKTKFLIQESTKRDVNRYVPINTKARCLLRKHKEISKFIEPDDYVISTKSGKTTTLKNINDTIKRICLNGELSIQNASSHTLRHTCASLLFSKGVPVEIIAMILGHSIEVCQKTYIHFVEGQLKSAVSKLDIIEM